MASRVNVDSPNLPKQRLSGPFPGPLPSMPTHNATKAQDPRLAGTARQSVDPQSLNPQQGHLNLPANSAFIQKPPAQSSPQVPPLSIPNIAPGPKSTESQSVPNRQGALFISDLVNSLIKVNKSEEEKERLQKEIVSISKNLQRAKQSQQFPSVIALFQQQLDAAKDELANHVKSIIQHRSLSNQAEDNFNSTLSQLNSQPQLEKIPERVQNLESTIKGMGQGPAQTISGDNPMTGNAEIERVQADMQTRNRDIAELKGKLDEVQHALKNPNGLEEALGYMNKIANSVALQSKWKSQFTNKISSLEGEVKAADKDLDHKISNVKKMVDTVEEELKVSNQHLETNISVLGGELRTTNERLEGKLSSIESDIRSLSATRHNLNDSALTQISQVETDLEAQRRQATERITAQEGLLASLRTQLQQNLDNGGGRVSSETTPTPHSGVLTRVASLEKRVQTQADLLNNIKNLHHDVDVIRVTELDTFRRNQESSQNSLRIQHDDTLKKVEDLTRKSEEMTKHQTSLGTDLHQLKGSLPGSFERLRTDLQSGLDGFETRLAPVSDLAQAVTKCESRIDSLNRAIRSLETRYTNITTGDLVNSMAHAMQQMYPSVDKLSQQLTAHRTEIEARLSALKTDADAFKADTESFKADTNQFKADTQQAQADARNAQASTEGSQAAQVSPEQLQNLTELPILLQQVKDLSDKLAPIERLISEHSDELQKNLELRSDLQNRMTAQDDTIEGIAQKADEHDEEFGTIAESTSRIDPLINKVDDHISQLQEVRQAIGELTRAAAERNTTAPENLDVISTRLEALEGRTKTEDEILDELRTELKNLQHQHTTGGLYLDEVREKLKDLADRNKAEDKNLDKLRTELKDLQHQHTTEDQYLDEVREKLRDLADRNTTEDNDISKLRDQVKVLAGRKPPVSLEKFTEQGDEVKMYIKRLRNAEDIFKALAGGAKISDVLDKLEESINAQKTLESLANGRSFTSTPTATPRTVPTGATLGAYQPVQFSVKGQADSSTPSVSTSTYSAMQARQPSQTPSGPSISHPSPYSGKSAEPRQVQNLKGKRRVSSVVDSDDERNTTESSSVVESSPAPSSSSPGSFTPGSSKKEKKKKAKKRTEQTEENPKTPSRLGKKRKRNKQDE
ncbi:hypothetical protein LT330_006649 [Penicillium expansum]|nr:hypothetical protein LT330_001308 [Penicillium expansum]KAK4869040.1 hypothetical protein LT330_006649 [Penicillium expansum]